MTSGYLNLFYLNMVLNSYLLYYYLITKRSSLQKCQLPPPNPKQDLDGVSLLHFRWISRKI